MKILKRCAVVFSALVLVLACPFAVGCKKSAPPEDDGSTRHSVLVYHQLDEQEPTLEKVDSYTSQQGYEFSTPTERGYYFSHWTSLKVGESYAFKGERIRYNIEKGSSGEKRIVAHFKSIPNGSNLQIKRVIDDTFDAGTIYTTYDNVADFTLPVINNYVCYDFTGWSGSGINGKVLNHVLPKGTSGTISFTANYETVPDYTITFSNEPVWDDGPSGTIKEWDKIETVTLTGVTVVKVHYNFYLEAEPIVGGWDAKDDSVNLMFGEWRYPNYGSGTKADYNPTLEKHFIFNKTNFPFEKGASVMLKAFMMGRFV